MSIVEKLKEMGACAESIKWVLSRPESERDLTSLWRDCPRADWMLWLARRCKPNPEEMGSVAWACANLAQAYAEGSGSESYAAYSAGAAASARAAYDAAAYSASAAYADAAAAASRTAYDAAFASARDAYAAAYAAAKAVTKAVARVDAAYDAAQKDCADMVRLLVTRPVFP